MRHHKQYRASFFIVFSILAALLLAGCGADEPSEDHLKVALEPELLRRGPYEIVSVTPNWVKTGEARLEGKTTIALRLKENCYARADLSEALAALKLDSAETALLRHTLAQVQTQAEPLRSALRERAPKSIEGQRFIKLTETAGDELSAEVALVARKNAEGWDLEIGSIALSRSLNGAPRASFSADALAAGSPEAEALIKGHVEAVRAYAATVDQAIADAANAAVAAAAQKRAALLEALKPGAIFLGTWEDARDKSIIEAGMVLEDVQAGSGLIRGFAFKGGDPRQKLPFTGTLRDSGMPLLLNIPADNPEMVAELDIRDGRLFGAGVNPKNSGRRTNIALATATEEALEAKTAAAVAEENALKAGQEAYQTALAAALAPGGAYQGTWISSDKRNRGEIGLYIESLAANGLSCAGYLFDPADRSKRKPFTGVVNKEHEALDALTITVVRGQGVAPSDKLTDTQGYFMEAGQSYSIRLALKSNAWAGQTSGRFEVELAPLPSFAELLAQDAAAEKQRQEAMQALVTPGAEYRGVWKRAAAGGDIGLKILTLSGNGLTFTAALFDPAESAVIWPYNGTYRDVDGVRVFTLTNADTKRVTGSFMGFGGTQHMLNDYRDRNSAVQLTPTADGLSGPLGSRSIGMFITLKKIGGAAQAQGQASAAATETSSPAASPVLAPANTAYPPLVSGDGKPKAAAHLTRLEGGTAELAVQVLAPGKTIEALRLDNLGGTSARWRSDGKEEAGPLAVSHNGASLSSGGEVMSLAAGDTEILLALSLKDNGAFADRSAAFRLTVFFAGGERAMCQVSLK